MFCLGQIQLVVSVLCMGLYVGRLLHKHALAHNLANASHNCGSSQVEFNVNNFRNELLTHRQAQIYKSLHKWIAFDKANTINHDHNGNYFM